MPSIARAQAPAAQRPPAAQPRPASIPEVSTPTAEDYTKSARRFAELDRKLVINKHDLDNEYVHHPERYRETGDEAVLALSFRDASKRHMDMVWSELEIQFRRAPDHKDAKEAHFKALINTAPRYRDAEELHARWHLLAARWQNLLESYDKRTKALDKLVELYIKGYWVSNGAGRTQGQVKLEEQHADAARADMSEGRPNLRERFGR